ncbi:hypothetical protein FIV00_02180 [Labrenzia sp. THAF82]|nr:hypothetical protein FIV00_02180 [Labrenzia sp. THAF82]
MTFASTAWNRPLKKFLRLGEGVVKLPILQESVGFLILKGLISFLVILIAQAALTVPQTH